LTGREDDANDSDNITHTLLYVTAAVGCVPAAFVNKLYGRRIGILLGAALLGIPSLIVAFTPGTTQMMVIRSVMGIGKLANSWFGNRLQLHSYTPPSTLIGLSTLMLSSLLLAAELAPYGMRGADIRLILLYAALGSLLGPMLHILFSQTLSEDLTIRLLLGAPFVPAAILFTLSIKYCPESPHRFVQKTRASYDPKAAYEIFTKLRRPRSEDSSPSLTRYCLPALEDMFGLYVSVKAEAQEPRRLPRFDLKHPWGFVTRFYKSIVADRYVRNAVIITTTVALIQHFCGGR
jgi:MFS family permease